MLFYRRYTADLNRRWAFCQIPLWWKMDVCSYFTDFCCYNQIRSIWKYV